MLSPQSNHLSGVFLKVLVLSYLPLALLPDTRKQTECGERWYWHLYKHLTIMCQIGSNNLNIVFHNFHCKVQWTMVKANSAPSVLAMWCNGRFFTTIIITIPSYRRTKEQWLLKYQCRPTHQISSLCLLCFFKNLCVDKVLTLWLLNFRFPFSTFTENNTHFIGEPCFMFAISMFTEFRDILTCRTMLNSNDLSQYQGGCTVKYEVTESCTSWVIMFTSLDVPYIHYHSPSHRVILPLARNQK